MKELHIGMDAYNIDSDEAIIYAIKSIIIYHQGELSTLKIVNTCTQPVNQDQYNYDQLIDAVNNENQPKLTIAESAYYTIESWLIYGYSDDEVRAYPYPCEALLAIEEICVEEEAKKPRDAAIVTDVDRDLEKIEKLLRSK